MSLIKQAIDEELARRRRASLMDPQDSSKAIRQGLEATRTKTSPNKPMKYVDVPKKLAAAGITPKNKIKPEKKGPLAHRQFRRNRYSLKRRLQNMRVASAKGDTVNFNSYREYIVPGVTFHGFSREKIRNKRSVNYGGQVESYLRKKYGDKKFSKLNNKFFTKKDKISPKIRKRMVQNIQKKIPYQRTHVLENSGTKRRASSLKTAKKNMPAVRKSLGLLRKIK